MEHLDGVINKPESDMTPQELQLHYFKMHDYDGNNLLDGLELATAITHVHKEVSGLKAFSAFFCLLIQYNGRNTSPSSHFAKTDGEGEI